MSDQTSIAVVGATSLKAEAFLKKLSAANLELGELFLIDDDTGAGEHVEFGNDELLVTSATEFDFAQVQYVILLGEPLLTEQLYPAIETAGCVVIDASGFLGSREDVSLANLISSDEVSGTVAIPESTTLQLMFALQPLLQETAIADMNIVALQCAAQGGKRAVEELGRQTAQLLNFQEVKPEFFAQQLAFNVIPQVGSLQDDGLTSSEEVLRKQITRLCVLSNESVNVQQIWIPVFYGDVVTVSFRTTDPLVVDSVISQWQEDPLVNFSNQQLQTPVSTASGKGIINISRLQSWTLSDDTTHISFCSMTDPIHLTALVTLLVLKRHLMA
jgi:aspartate-semialdehyde dehydrogenase